MRDEQNTKEALSERDGLFCSIYFEIVLEHTCLSI